MPFSNVTYTDLDDLMTKFVAFAVTNGWTQDDLDLASNEAAISKGTKFMSWSWDVGQSRIFWFQALGFTGGNSPGNHPNDAGPQTGNARGTVIADGPANADFFSGVESGSEYLIAAVERAPGLYTYWAFGDLIKVGDWTGGEFLGKQSWPGHGSAGADQDAPFDARNIPLLDSLHSEGGQGDTVHIEGVHSQPALEKWGEMRGSGSTNTDRNGEPRALLEGASRGGPWFNSLNFLEVQPTNGFIPLQPWPIHYRSAAQWTLLGFIPGMRGLKIRFITSREEFTLGSDVWKAYPWVKKSDADSGTPESENEGMAFLKTP